MKKQLVYLIFSGITTLCHAQNVGIGTTNPHQSAILDLSSTTKGLLLPQMTSIQRTAISSPSTGLIVLQTDGITGLYIKGPSAWEVLATPSPSYSVGFSSVQGGYILSVSPDGKHGLVVETQDQGHVIYYESNSTISNPANHNTTYKGSDFRDWRLPTKFELNLIYLAKAAIGGFVLTNYWSSTPYDWLETYCRDFANGTQNSNSNIDLNNIRTVRSF